MLCDIFYKYPTGELEHDDEFGCVDLDYWNIRQYRKLYTKLAKKNEDISFGSVHLEIRPKKKEIIY